MNWKKQSLDDYGGHLTQRKGSRQSGLLVFLLLTLLAACSQVTEEPVLADLTPGELVFDHERGGVEELTLRNDHNVPVDVTAASITGGDAAAFSLVDAPDFPLTLDPHQQISLKVRFEPHARQSAFRATLRVSGGKPEHADVEVAMYGDTDGVRPSEGEGWKPLFNGRDLEGWYTWLPSTGKNADPQGVFKAENGILHILDVPVTGQVQEFGYLATTETYKNFRLRFEYRWGSKRFKPRDAAKRDSGVLYHVVGPDKVWPCSVELQIQEGDTGDFWFVDGTAATTTVASADTDAPAFQEGGEPFTTRPGSFVRLAKSHENDKETGWNTVEVVVSEDKAEHYVNGELNNAGWNFQQPDPNNKALSVPLSEGRILFQAEGAEVFYRNIEIMSLD